MTTRNTIAVLALTLAVLGTPSTRVAAQGSGSYAVDAGRLLDEVTVVSGTDGETIGDASLRRLNTAELRYLGIRDEAGQFGGAGHAARIVANADVPPSRRIPLLTGHEVSGRCVRSDGTPIPDVEIWILDGLRTGSGLAPGWPRDPNQPRTQHVRATSISRSRSGSDGRFRLRMATRRARLLLRHRDFMTREFSSSELRQSDLDDIALSPGRPLRGRIQDLEGKHVSGARVRVVDAVPIELAGALPATWFSRETISGVDGTFDFGTSLRGRPSRLSIEHPDHETYETTNVTDDSLIEIRLAPRETIEIRVESSDGPIAGRLGWWTADGESLPVRTGEDGWVRIPEIGASQAILEIFGYRAEVIELARFRRRATPSPWPVEVRAATGRIVEVASGDGPVVGAHIDLYEFGSTTPAGRRVGSFRTDSSGRAVVPTSSVDLLVTCRAAGHVEEETSLDGKSSETTTIELRKSRSLEGRLITPTLDDSATPIEDATIVVRAPRGSYRLDYEVKLACAGRGGRFVLHDLPIDRRYRATILHPAIANQSVLASVDSLEADVGEASERAVTATVRVEPGVPLRGLVRGPSGRPVADADLTFDPVSDFDPYIPERRATTDQSGRFESPLVPSGEYWVEVSAQDRIPIEPIRVRVDGSRIDIEGPTLPKDPAVVELVVRRGRGVRGRVVRDNGEAVEGALVFAISGGREGFGDFRQTDADGDFYFDAAPDGEYELVARHSRWGETRLHIGRDDSPPTEIVLGRTADLLLKLHTRDGQPLSPGTFAVRTITLLRHGSPTWIVPRIREDGTIVIQGQRAGVLDVRIEFENRPPAVLSDIRIKEGSDRIELSAVVPEKLPETVVTVVDSKGSPIAGAEVQVLRASFRSWYPVSKGETDARGQYRSGERFEPEFGLAVQARGHASRLLDPLDDSTLRLDKDNVRVALESAKTVTLTVRERDGRPTTDLVATLQRDDLPFWSVVFSQREVPADDRSRFIFDGLESGRYAITLLKGYDSVRTQFVDVENDDIAIEFIRPAPFTISGRLQLSGASGRSPDRAVVRVESDGFASPDVPVDDDGSFEVEVPQPGSYRIFVAAGDLKVSRNVELSGPNEPIVLDVRSTSLRGRLIDSMGSPVVSANGFIVSGPARQRFRTDEDGEFRVDGLVVGEMVRVQFTPNLAPSDESTSEVTHWSFAPARELRLELENVIEVRTEATRTVEFSWSGGEGLRIRGTRVALVEDGVQTPLERAGSDGWIVPERPATYLVRARGIAPQLVEIESVTRSRVRVPAVVAGRLSVEVRDRRDQPVEGCTIELSVNGRRLPPVIGEASTDERGRGEFDLEPGRYDVRARRSDGSAVDSSIDVEAGRSVNLDLRL